MTPQEYSAPDFTAPALARAPEARFEAVAADGVLPDGFFSTSNLPTYVRAGGRWHLPTRPRIWCNWPNPSRSARSTTSVFTMGMSMPDSMMVVHTSTS